MCELTTIALVTMAAGTALSAAGSIQQGNAARAQASYQSQVERNNATIAERQAQDAEQRGRVEEQRQRIQNARLAGTQRTAFAGAGVDLGSGSPLDVLMDTRQLGELDALTIRSNAAREAYGFRTQSSNLMAQSALTQRAGQNAQAAGAVGAGSTLLTGTGNLAATAVKFKKGAT